MLFLLKKSVRNGGKIIAYFSKTLIILIGKRKKLKNLRMYCTYSSHSLSSDVLINFSCDADTDEV